MEEHQSFATEEEAMEYSASLAKTKGCTGSTLYWYGWAQAQDGLWYCPPLPEETP